VVDRVCTNETEESGFEGRTNCANAGRRVPGEVESFTRWLDVRDAPTQLRRYVSRVVILPQSVATAVAPVIVTLRRMSRCGSDFVSVAGTPSFAGTEAPTALQLYPSPESSKAIVAVPELEIFSTKTCASTVFHCVHSTGSEKYAWPPPAPTSAENLGKAQIAWPAMCLSPCVECSSLGWDGSRFNRVNQVPSLTVPRFKC